MTVPSAAPGQAAILRALKKLYPAQRPRHFETVRRWADGGPDPLDAVSVFEAAGPLKHWHYVSFGLSELYDKVSAEPDRSGFGFELTFRLARAAKEKDPPTWPIALLHNLARYVFQSGNVFHANDYVDFNGPIAVGVRTLLRGGLFTQDPQLPPRTTPNGQLTFVQLVGVTADEYDAARAWDPAGVLELLAVKNRQLVTDVRRGSIRKNARVEKAIAKRLSKEGSTTAQLALSQLDYQATATTATLTVGADEVPLLRRLLPGRLSFGRPLKLTGPTHGVVLLPAPRFAATLHVLCLSNADVADLLDVLKPKVGRYHVNERLSVEVVRTRITDDSGRLIRTVG